MLIPRPETELLVEVALELAPATVLDVGTGSGAVALAVADELPATEVTATDTSADALRVAQENAARLGLERVKFATGTLPARGSFDLLLANLPYVGESEFQQLEPEIREHEPRTALVPGPTGMEAIESLSAKLTADPSLAAAVALEVGEGQASATATLLEGAGYERVEARADLAGIDRVVLGRRGGVSASERGHLDRARRRRTPPARRSSARSRPAAWPCFRPTPSMGSPAIRSTRRRSSASTGSRDATTGSPRRSCTSRPWR